MNFTERCIVWAVSCIVMGVLISGCGKTRTTPAAPAPQTNIIQKTERIPPSRPKVSKEEPDTNWFAAVDSTHGRLAGMFRDANGNPVTNVSALCCKKDIKAGNIKPPPEHRLGFVVETNGTYLSEPIDPGLYECTFSSPEYKKARASFIIKPEDTTLLEVCFETYPVITCTVVDAETELPVPDAEITGWSGPAILKGVSWSSPTTAEGIFTVTKRDKYISLCVTHPEYSTVKIGIGGKPRHIRLFRAGDIAVTIVDEDGNLSTNTHNVLLYGSFKQLEFYCSLFAKAVCTNGICMFPGVSSDNVPYKVMVDNGVGEVEKLEPVPGETTNVLVRLQPAGSLAVNLSFPLSNCPCYVSLQVPYPELVYNNEQHAQLNNQAHFLFKPVLTGSYPVIIFISQKFRLTTNIVIETGENVVLNISEKQFPAGCIKGTFRTVSGKPLAGTIRVYKHGDNMQFSSASIITGAFCVAALQRETMYDLAIIPGLKLTSQTNITVSAVMPDGPPLDIVIPDVYSVRGMVVDKNHEILNAKICIDGSGWRSYSGGFELFPLFPGTYSLSIQAEKYAPIAKEVTIVDADVDLGMIECDKPGITLRGTVLDSQGTPCRACYLKLGTMFIPVTPGLPNVSLSAHVDEKGTFTVTGVPENRVLAVVINSANEQLYQEIGPFSRDTDLEPLRLIPKQVLLVNLCTEDGQPAAGAFVNFKPADNNGIWAGNPDYPGVLTISKRRTDIFENPSRVFRPRYTVTEEATNHISITLPAWF